MNTAHTASGGGARQIGNKSVLEHHRELQAPSQGTVYESVERRPRVRETGCSVRGGVKSMTYHLHLSLSSLALGINRIGQGLDRSVSG